MTVYNFCNVSDLFLRQEQLCLCQCSVCVNAVLAWLLCLGAHCKIILFQSYRYMD